ncbi:MAG: [FeFe] hydrogenase, group A [Christensenellaceae bacterium]|jgi:NADH-quinone oxidoreductase subunit G|nr:[FeFe] hydrogenase, group A [Christensenellaceae bacterium]
MSSTNNEVKTAIVDGMITPLEGEKNLLELIRKANVELPTFCYHSDISVYGACRMCMVEVEGRGIVPACSTPIAPNMVVKTNTKQIRSMRKMILELMLASHDQSCTTCPKSDECKLQKLSRKMGITKVRFKQMVSKCPIDDSSPSIIRDSSKCVLCGDCVRVCKEIQSVGALDIANRGAYAKVTPFYGQALGKVECVNCGQCIKICPVGALMPKYNINEAWDAIHDPTKTVIVQLAPAVRVALGEYFGQKPGSLSTGKITAALRMIGVDKVYDTCFSADLTILEEANEFLNRFTKKEKLPQFTSCCPAWVKFAEQNYPELLNNLSSCKSPQQMFSSLAKEKLTKDLNIARENLVIISIMPCTAKKYEASRPEFSVNGNRDTDIVLTTKELALMMKERGIEFDNIEPASFDMPFGFKTGAGVIFGASGGVGEAVLRFASATLTPDAPITDFKQVRGPDGIKTAEVSLGDTKVSVAVVSGLSNARKLIDRIKSGEATYDIIEVMACCGGCVNGGGQPVPTHEPNAVAERAKGLYADDKTMLFRNSGANPYLQKLYAEEITHEKAHELFHTKYQTKPKIAHEDIVLLSGHSTVKKYSIKICFGACCLPKGAQELYVGLVKYIKEQGLVDDTIFTASFGGASCQNGPVLEINGKQMNAATLAKARKAIDKLVKKSG